MVPGDCALGITQQTFQGAFGPEDRAPVRVRNRPAGKFREKSLRITDLPAHINHRQQVIMIGRQGLIELVIKILYPLVEPVNPLDRPGPFEVRAAGFGYGSRRFAKGGDEHNFGFADLEYKEPQAEDDDQQDADDDGQGIFFHGWRLNHLVGGGNVRFSRRSSRILSSRFRMMTSWVLVASRTYLRAFAIELVNACK